MSKIRIGIVGYGNLGRGVEASVKLQPDMELVGVFRRKRFRNSFWCTYILWKIYQTSKVKSMLWFFAVVLQQTLSNKLQW